ncbi:MAG: hypothetical protein ACOZHQ_16135 [Thermodesulfobacteriota bacterium]
MEFGENKRLLALAHLRVELEAELGHKVDVLTCRALHHRLRERILQEQAPIL